jgi:spermidine synthase
MVVLGIHLQEEADLVVSASKDKLKFILPLMLSAFFVAVASIVYELIIAGISSYLLGNSLQQFSITIGLFMTAMGLGSLFSKYVQTKLMAKFMVIEIILALLGGFTGTILFHSYATTEIYTPIMVILILIIGVLTGFELPLLMRIIEEYEEIKVTLANLMSVDYLGGLIGSVLFPLYLLPNLGFIKASCLMGLINLVVAVVIFFRYQNEFNLSWSFLGALLIVVVVLVGGFINVEEIESDLEEKLYRDPVIYSQQSDYQKIVITRQDSDLRLFLDGDIQFSSQDEHRYHEALVHPALSLAPSDAKVLILGGGDGLAVREILKYPGVKKVDLVDLDPAVTDLGEKFSDLVELNNNSLSADKVDIYNQDAYQYVQETVKEYDVAILDLPDPKSTALNKMYTVNFYKSLYSHLTENGVVSIQSTSSYFAPEAFWTINKTIKEAGFQVGPYHCYIPSFGDWGFNLAVKQGTIDPSEIEIKADTEFLTEDNLAALFNFGQDILKDKSKAEVNTLVQPSLVRNYYDSWEENL